MARLIGIAGGSGSGKTTFANKLVKLSESGKVAILHQDSYYLPNPPEEAFVHGKPNFDHPLAFDWDLLENHLLAIKKGISVQAPVYDFKMNDRSGVSHPVGPCAVLIVEGIYTLWNPSIRNMFDFTVFVDVESDIRFIRRLHRDVHERGRNLDGIITQYYDTVRPMYREFLAPTRQYADLTVGEDTDMAAVVLAARITEMASEVGSSHE